MNVPGPWVEGLVRAGWPQWPHCAVEEAGELFVAQGERRAGSRAMVLGRCAEVDPNAYTNDLPMYGFRVELVEVLICRAGA